MFNNNAVSNPKSLSEAEVESFRTFLPTVNDAYWLDDNNSKGSISWQSYTTSDNNLDNNTLTASGKVDGNEFDNDEIAYGSVAFNKDVNLSNYVASAGGVYTHKIYAGNDSTPSATFKAYQASEWLKKGDRVYNNYFLNDYGFTPDKFFMYASGKLTQLRERGGSLICGYVSNGKVYQVSPGQKLSSGTVVICPLVVSADKIDADKGQKFAFATNGYTTTAFKKLDKDITVGRYMQNFEVCGITRFYPTQTPVTGQAIKSAEKLVRPAYSLNNSKVVFLRNADSSGNLSVSSKFGDVPNSIAIGRADYKTCVKSDNVTITNNLQTAKVSTEKSSDNHATSIYGNGVIKVPYGAQQLTLQSDSFTTSNANYISALANSNGTKKYAVLGHAGSVLTIDLGSIVNTNKIGEKISLSFYGEQANSSNNTDEISSSPVTIEVEVVEGAQQTITYDADGGSGALPKTEEIKAGTSHAFATGSALSKGGSLFSCWQIEYVAYGETDKTTRIVKAGVPVIVPDASNGQIKAIALYGGSAAKKDTDTKPSVYTVAWDSNAPDGYSVRFSTSDASYNDDKTVRYDKLKDLKNNNKMSVAAAPDIDTTGKELQVFDGWYTEKDGGEKIKTTEIEVDANATYFAHWVTSYTITYDTADGVFSDSSTQKEVKATPNKRLGDKWISEKPTRSEYGFTGWYTENNGLGQPITSDTVIDKSMTIYASWVGVTFFGPATTDLKTNPNPRLIEGVKYGLDFVQSAARDIAAKGSSSEYYSRFRSWMYADSYHLYTLLKDEGGNYLDADQSENWVELRIIHVGQHDGDNSGLTFVAVHAMPEAYRMNSADIAPDNWASSELYQTVNSSNFYAKFDSKLISNMRPFNSSDKKGKLWPMSATETFTSAQTSNGYYISNGSQYEYWRYKGIGSATTKYNPSKDEVYPALNLYYIRKDGNETPWDQEFSRYADPVYWLREPAPKATGMSASYFWSAVRLNWSSGGYLEDRYVGPYVNIGFVPCFAL